MSEVQPQHSQNEDRQIIITRTVHAPRELVWRAYVDPDQVVQWWGPNGFTTTNHQMDVRPGGMWRYTMHGPDGHDYPNRVIYDEVVEPERLAYTHDDDGGVENICFHTTLTFEAVDGDANATKVTLCMTASSQAERDHIKREYGAVVGGIQTIGRLAAHVNPAGPGAITVVLPSAREVMIARTYVAPRQLVFDLWTKPEHVKQWLYGPEEYPMVICEMDTRPGGQLRYGWLHRDENDIAKAMIMHGVFREVDPPCRLVHTEVWEQD